MFSSPFGGVYFLSFSQNSKLFSPKIRFSSPFGGVYFLSKGEFVYNPLSGESISYQICFWIHISLFMFSSPFGGVYFLSLLSGIFRLSVGFSSPFGGVYFLSLFLILSGLGKDRSRPLSGESISYHMLIYYKVDRTAVLVPFRGSLFLI